MQEKPTVLIAKAKDVILKAARQAGIMPCEITWGSKGYAGRCGTVFLIWGVDPSPLAQRAIGDMIRLYFYKPHKEPGIFYVCYAGTHTSVVASMLHLGNICVEDIQSQGPKALLRIPYFDRRTTFDIGVPVCMGKDVNGAYVYALGTGWLSRTLELCLCDLIELMHPNARACLCSVRGVLDFQARVGGFLSRRLSLVSPGRQIVSHALSKKVPVLYQATRYCLDLSFKWKDNGNHTEGEVVWIDGSRQGRAGLSG